MCRSASPLLVTTRVCPVGSNPIVCAPKSRAGGSNSMPATGSGVPIPETCTRAGSPPVSSVMTRSARTSPTSRGTKVTSIVHVSPCRSSPPQPLSSEKASTAGTSDTSVTVIVPPPVFDTTTPRVESVPTVSSPNSTGMGATKRTGVPSATGSRSVLSRNPKNHTRNPMTARRLTVPRIQLGPGPRPPPPPPSRVGPGGAPPARSRLWRVAPVLTLSPMDCRIWRASFSDWRAAAVSPKPSDRDPS
jgi:hypothetical protein